MTTALDPALEVARHVLAAARDRRASRRPGSRRCRRRARGRRSSKVTRVRSDGFSNSSATCWPPSAWAVGAFGPSGRSAFIAVPPARAVARSSAGVEVEDREEVHLRAVVMVGSVLRPVLRVDLHVLGAEVAGPHRGRVRPPVAEVHLDLERRRLSGSSAASRRPLVERAAVLEEHERPDPDARAARARTPPRSGRPPRPAGPSSGRRRARRSSRAASWRSRARPSRRRPRSRRR